MSRSAPWLVSTDTQLAELLTRLGSAPSIAVDTESDGFFRYRARLCVLQLAVPGTLAVVDTLAAMDLGPLWRFLGDPARECVLHDAEGDVLLLQRRLGVVLGRLFDTQHAVKMLGSAQVGLAALLESMLGVRLDKGEQRSDWGRRPLSASQLVYAAGDVEHLLLARERLHADLVAKGRLEMALQGFERIRTRNPQEPVFDPEGWLELRDARKLGPAGRGLLRAAYLWREELARRRECAPFRVVGPDTLVEIARAQPADAAALHRVRGMPAWLRGTPEEDTLLAALRGALPVPDTALPPRAPRPDPQVEARFDALRAWRTRVAKEMGVDISVLASNTSLRTLALSPPASAAALADAAELLPWQRETLAEGMFQALTGTPAR
ncbi:MAG: ribonuclease D [Deltaproteobacteria bacterium]|nr:ribonuclease D [Deltaproteobacteria bacterium]